MDKNKDLSKNLKTREKEFQVQATLARAARERNAQLELIRHMRILQEKFKIAQGEAIKASNAKSSFLANMSHEIRTPMNGVIGMSELALSTELSSEQREYVETIKSSGELLVGIINDILDFSKIEAGQIILEEIPFDLYDVLKKTVNSIGVLIKDKGINLVEDIAPHVPRYFIGDPLRLRQILTNLLSNATKFTETGRIEMAVQVIKGSADPSGTPNIKTKDQYLLQFSVRDTGIGLTPKQQKVIFNPFSQADTSTTRKYGGTGLGLSIVKRMVELMGGQIWVESPAPGPTASSEGPGTIFYFTISFKTASDEVEIEKQIPDEKLKETMISPKTVESLKILLAEDNKINQVVATKMLTKRGHSVTVAENGKEVLDLLSQRSFDLVLMDVQMPEMDGYEATRAIREEEGKSGSHIRIIAMTAHALKGDREKCIETGMDDYITKPIKMERLFEVVEGKNAGAPVVEENKINGNNVFSIEKTLKQVGGDKEVLKEVIDIFRQEYPKQLKEIRQAIKKKDAETVRRVAHTIKGAVGNFGAEGAWNKALSLENIGKSEDLSNAVDAFNILKTELKRLDKEFNKV